MNNLNSILVEGNMVRDPELRSTKNGKLYCVFSIASNRFYKTDQGFEKEVSFFDVECWGKLAETIADGGKKGKGARIVGRLKQNRWIDRDGKSRSSFSIVAEHVEFNRERSKHADAENYDESKTDENEEARAVEFEPALAF